MKTKSRKNYLSLAISTLLLLAVANSSVAENARGGADPAVLTGKPAPVAPATRLVSINSSGTASGNSFSFSPVISADGRFVAFRSFANDLVANDSNGTSDVFVRDLKTGTTTLASVNSSGITSGNKESFSPVLSANGRFVAFHSFASNLVANDTNGADDLFLRDLKTGVTSLISINSSGTASGNAPPFPPPRLPLSTPATPC